MKLGNYVEMRGQTDDISGAMSFYEGLGCRRIKENVVTDGILNIKFMPESAPEADIAYYGSDPIGIAESGILVDHNIITTPNGVRILLMSEPSPIPAPNGQPISRLGKFGEYSLSVRSFEETSAFWQSIGFRPAHTSLNPYPWGILTDGLLLIGIHEHIAMPGMNFNPDEIPPAITYYAPDMEQRIKQFQAEGIDVTPAMDGGDPDKLEHGRFTGPGKLDFYIFTGEI